MAIYKHDNFLDHSEDTAFDPEHKPGTVPPHSGIYRCMGCGHEIVAEHGRQLPPENHHQHSTQQGSIRWRLIVYADHRQKYES
jgi:hypothetical protein